jgi:hypothetical protein
MRSGDRPGLQNRRAAGYPVTGGFDPHSLPPHIKNRKKWSFSPDEDSGDSFLSD